MGCLGKQPLARGGFVVCPWALGVGEGLGALALGAYADYVPDDSELFQEGDYEAGGIGEALPEPEAVEGRGGEGVVVVVPGLAHRQGREPEDVAGFVLDVEALAPEEVADGVDRPGDVMEQEDAHQTTPKAGR